MNSLVIKQTGQPGRDAKMFCAYEALGRSGSDRPLGISASTTGNATYGALRCAAKAFMKFTEPGGELDEIETRIKLSVISSSLGIWRAELAANE